MTYSRAAARVILTSLSAFIAIYLTVGLTCSLPFFLQKPFHFNPGIDGVIFLGFLVAVMAAIDCFLPEWRVRLEQLVESAHGALTIEAESVTPQALGLKIAFAAAASLFIELVLIRWQANLFPVFALYKNYTLLACFCGLGIGYAMADKRLTLPAALPLLALIVGLLSALRYHTGAAFQGILFVVPVQEESYVATLRINRDALQDLARMFPVFCMLVTTFLLNAFTLIPIGQYCGFLMNRVNPLAGYGSNLLGSLSGVGLLFFLGWQWTEPVAWFGIAAALILWPQRSIARARSLGIISAFACLLLAAWPFNPFGRALYSPYQMIEIIPKKDGLMSLFAAGTYYQKIYNLSAEQDGPSTDPYIQKVLGHYELPYRVATALDNVAIVGAGAGNDVAAALRMGARAVDAVEIDPVILGLGLYWHPEHPYNNPRVRRIINDARNFFRESAGNYDAIVYGVLDAHVVLSVGSGVRLDSFVYTKEGLREAYDHLKPQGILAVSFALPTPVMGQKIFRMLSALPQAGRPRAIVTGYDNVGTTLFIVRKGDAVDLPADFIDSHSLLDATPWYEAHDNETLDLPSDDWPFFYMDHRSFPLTYIISLAIILSLSALLMFAFLPRQKSRLRFMPFFFLGSGFMLIETKAITELGLLFGNTWQMVGFAIAGVLVMGFLANAFCLRKPPASMTWAWVLLLLLVVLGYACALPDRNLLPAEGWRLGKVVLLFGPLFFSGVLFSGLLDRANNTASVMAHNLAGAMLGGALEYNAMQFGFASLYLIALALYALAWTSTALGRPKPRSASEARAAP